MRGHSQAMHDIAIAYGMPTVEEVIHDPEKKNPSIPLE